MTTPLFDSILRDFEFTHDFSLIAQRALSGTRADGVAIALKEATEYVCRATAGVMAPTIGIRLQNDTGITAACIRSGQAVICGDAMSDERVNPATCQALGIASIVVVPITHKGTVVGIVEALSHRVNAFGAAEQAVLATSAREIQERTFEPFAPLHDGEARTPDSAALMTPIESEEEMPAGVDECSAAVAFDALPGTQDPRVGSKFAGIAAPLLFCALLLAALLMILAPTHKPGAQPSALRTLPLRRTEFLAPSTVLVRPAGNASARRASAQPAEMKQGRASLRELEAAARAGDASAQLRLANALASGAGGAADPVMAEAWYTVAHLAGVPEAGNGMRLLSRHLSNSQTAAVRERLATMYWKGIGVKPDPITAYVWVTLAEAAGAHGVAAKKHSMARTMGPAEVAEANLRAQQWLKQHHQLMAQNTNN